MTPVEEAGHAGLPRMLEPLRQRDFALLWFGQTVSGLGDGAYQVALLWTAYAITGSASQAGLVLAAFSIPQIIFLLAGGVIGDRFSRWAIVLVSDALSAPATGAVAVLALTGHLTVTILIVLAAIFGTTSAFFGPAYNGLVPEIVPEERLQSANALIQISTSATIIVGPSLGGVLYAWTKATGAFGFDALSFVAGTLSTAFVRKPVRSGRVSESILHDLGQGWRLVRSTTWLWLSIGLASLANATGIAAYMVLLPAVIRQLHLGVTYLALAASIVGIGAIVGSLVLAQLPTLRHRGIIMYAGWVGLNLTPILAGLAPGFWLIAVGSALLGVGFSSEAIWRSLVQQLIPKEYLSRVFSLDMLGSFAFLPLGYALAGVLASTFGVREVLVAGGVLGAGLTIGGMLTPAIRKLD
ncbi:MAG: MFS transporter [Chloroflexota bacterium]